MCPKKWPTSGPLPPGVMMFNPNSSKQVKTSFSLPSLPMTLEDAGVMLGVGVKNKEE